MAVLLLLIMILMMVMMNTMMRRLIMEILRRNMKAVLSIRHKQSNHLILKCIISLS